MGTSSQNETTVSGSDTSTTLAGTKKAIYVSFMGPFSWQDYLRPSVESILQSSLLSEAVAEEQRKAQSRLQRRSADSDVPLHKPAETAHASATEIRLKEQALRDREQALKEREEQLESKTFLSPALSRTYLKHMSVSVAVVWPRFWEKLEKLYCIFSREIFDLHQFEEATSNRNILFCKEDSSVLSHVYGLVFTLAAISKVE